MHKAKDVVKDQAERLEKPSVDLFKKECKDIYHREHLEQNKRPFSKGPSFSKQEGEWVEIATFTKSSITNGEVSAIGIKADDSLVRKYNKKATFSNKNIPQLKENTAVHPIMQNLFPNVKVSNFPLAGGLQYLVKHCEQLTGSPKF